MMMIPCAAHGRDLIFADICKQPFVYFPLAFRSSMTRYWRTHGFPKAVLERCRQAENGCVLKLQRPGVTSWKSQLSAAAALLKTQGAMEKAVVDAEFKSVCLLKGSNEQRRASADVAQAEKRDSNCDELGMVFKLLEPLGTALDVGQSDGGCHGVVRSALFHLHHRLFSFDYPASSERLLLRHHVMQSLHELKIYTLRPVHILSYLLDPRCADRADQPYESEMYTTFDLLKTLAAAPDIKIALVVHGCDKEADLPTTCKRATSEAVLAEYTAFRSKAVDKFVLEKVWEARTFSNPQQWWKTWGSAVPHLKTVAVKIMKMLVGFAAGEWSFSNASHTQSRLRTRTSYEKLHKLLYIYLNSRVLPDRPAYSEGQEGGGGGAPTDLGRHAIELDGAEDGPVDLEEEELGTGTAAELLAASLDEGDEGDCLLKETDDSEPLRPATQQSETL